MPSSRSLKALEFGSPVARSASGDGGDDGAGSAASSSRRRGATPGRPRAGSTKEEQALDDFGVRLSIIAINLLLFAGVAAALADIAVQHWMPELGAKQVATLSLQVFASLFAGTAVLAWLRKSFGGSSGGDKPSSKASKNRRKSPVGSISALVFVYYGVAFFTMIAAPMLTVVRTLREQGLRSGVTSQEVLITVAYIVFLGVLQGFMGFSTFAQTPRRARAAPSGISREFVFVQGHSFIGLLTTASYFLVRFSNWV